VGWWVERSECLALRSRWRAGRRHICIKGLLGYPPQLCVDIFWRQHFCTAVLRLVAFGGDEQGEAREVLGQLSDSLKELG